MTPDYENPDAEFSVGVRRYGNLYLVASDELRGAHATGHTLDEALAGFAGCIPDLFSVMVDDVKSGREPSEQMKAFQRLLGLGDRSNEPERPADSLNQLPSSKDRE